MKKKYKKLLNFVAAVGFVGAILLLAASTITTIIYEEPYVMAGIIVCVLYCKFAEIIIFTDEKEENRQKAVKYYDSWIRRTKQV